MAGLMMLATVDLVDKRWWRAAAYLSLGLAIKPLCLVLVLLAAVLYPATMWRLGDLYYRLGRNTLSRCRTELCHSSIF